MPAFDDDALSSLGEAAARAASMSQGRNALDLFRQKNLLMDLRNQCEAASAASVLVEDPDRAHLGSGVDWKRLESLPAEYTLAFADESGDITQVMLDPRKLLESSQWLGELAPALRGKRG